MNYNNHPKLSFVYVGIDCHKTTHTACVINAFNESLEYLTFGNDNTEFDKLLNMVEKYTTDGLKAVYGLEDTKHLGHTLAKYLLSKNQIVKHVPSTMTANERKKLPIQDKTDEMDAKCIAKVTLDELDNLEECKDDEIYWTLKQMIKLRTTLNTTNVKLKNKLHAQLLHHYPNYKDFFSGIDLISALDFWETYPSPNMIKDFTPEQLKENLKTKGNFSINKANLILEKIKGYDYTETTYQENRNILIKTMVNNIKTNNSQIEEMDKNIVELYDKLDIRLHTFKGLTKMSSAEIVAEIGDISRFSNSAKLAKYCGIAPINCSSGNHDHVKRNEYGNRKLNGYIYYLACRSVSPGRENATPTNAIFLDYYKKKINNGKTKRQAITCVMRRIINIIYNILDKNIEYKHPEELNEKCLQAFQEEKQKEQEQIVSSS